MSTRRGTLRGPLTDDAIALVQIALSMTRDEAITLSRAYEADDNPHYLAQCVVVTDALQFTDRELTPGWFQDVFAEQNWVEDTKALHAVADAVMVTLVADIVSEDVVRALTRPWITVAASVV